MRSPGDDLLARPALTAQRDGDVLRRDEPDDPIEILHHQRPVSLLRGRQAQAFAARIAAGTAENGQRLMARLTGNYRRGNERHAGHHLRNEP